MRKINCWEHNGCGREAGGKRVHDLGTCPASEDTVLDGVHGGRNSGRTCWMIAGTLCRGGVQGTFAQKFKDCQLCAFYKKVKDEEFPNFQLSMTLIKKLQGV